MPSPTTAGDVVQGALRLLGAIATGDTPTADEFKDGLNTFNDLLELLSTSNLAMYASATEQFPTVANQALYTIGPAGNWNTTRPVRISGSPICTFNGVDFEIDQIGQDDYDAIGLKTLSQPIVEKLLYVNDWPLGKITLWPVPSQVVTITLNTGRVLTAVTDVTTAVNFPPGYAVMFRYNLAIMLAPDYGISVPDELANVARTTLAAIKRANKLKRTSQFDEALSGPGPVTWQSGT